MFRDRWKKPILSSFFPVSSRRKLGKKLEGSGRVAHQLCPVVTVTVAVAVETLPELSGYPVDLSYDPYLLVFPHVWKHYNYNQIILEILVVNAPESTSPDILYLYLACL